MQSRCNSLGFAADRTFHEFAGFVAEGADSLGDLVNRYSATIAIFQGFLAFWKRYRLNLCSGLILREMPVVVGFSGAALSKGGHTINLTSLAAKTVVLHWSPMHGGFR
jgi:hypothetical protein